MIGRAVRIAPDGRERCKSYELYHPWEEIETAIMMLWWYGILLCMIWEGGWTLHDAMKKTK